MENIILDGAEIAKEHDYRDYLAPKWKRLANFLIDYYLVLFVWFAGMILITSYMDRERDIVPDNVFTLLMILPFISIPCLYFFCERYYGKTLGKLITGTKVISVVDEPITSKQVLIRTLSRVVPFDPFSILFGYSCWHDDWADTAVVNKNYPG